MHPTDPLRQARRAALAAAWHQQIMETAKQALRTPHVLAETVLDAGDCEYHLEILARRVQKLVVPIQ